ARAGPSSPGSSSKIGYTIKDELPGLEGPALAALYAKGEAWLKGREGRPFESGKLVLDRVADLALQVGEVAVAFRKLRQKSFVERKPRVGLDRVDAVLLIGEAPQDDAPASLTLFQKVVKAAAANDIAEHALDLCTL